MDLELADKLYDSVLSMGIRTHERRNHAKTSVPVDAEIYLESQLVRGEKRWRARERRYDHPKVDMLKFISSAEGGVGSGAAAQPN